MFGWGLFVKDLVVGRWDIVVYYFCVHRFHVFYLSVSVVVVDDGYVYVVFDVVECGLFFYLGWFFGA